MLVVCLLMAAICVGLAGTVSSVPAVLLMSVSIFFLYVTGAIYWAIIRDVVRRPASAAPAALSILSAASPASWGGVAAISCSLLVNLTALSYSPGTIAALGALLVLFVIKNSACEAMKASQA
ncbi:hypothetical protein MJ585_25140 [Klebsiella pneumoniae]|nr:hypothetical protein MJ585_25140 [Klebsiella pneumoniae]